MALTIGELTGYIRIDDGEVRPALRRTEGDLRASGQRMTADAGQAGTAAGRALGDGAADAAQSGLDDVADSSRAAGRQAGDSLADGVRAGLSDVDSDARAAGDDAGQALSDGVRAGLGDVDDDARAAGLRAGAGLGDGMADGATAEVGRVREVAAGALEKVRMLALGAGVAAGAALMQGIASHLDQSKIAGRLGAQLGATPAVAQRYGKIAGQMYADAVTEDFQTAADAIRHTMSAGLLPPGATNAQIKSISTHVADLANTFELDLGMTASAAGAMIKNGLAKDSKQALDILTQGLEGAGMAGDDLVETFTEYSPVFKAAGISAQTAMGLIKQSIEGGWVKDTDKMADAMKEFSLRAVADSDSVADSFKALGLDAGKMGADVGAGGQRGEQALGKVITALGKMPASAQRALIVQELFGGPGEDLGAALFTLDVNKASKSMDGAAGAADRMGDSLRNNAATRLEKFKRGMQQGIVTVIGGQVIPALARFGTWAQSNASTLKVLAGVVGGALVPVLVLMGVTATISAARTVTAWVTSGASAVASAGSQVLSGARVVGAWVLMGVQSMIQGARMAAAWVLAMGPVGWVIAAIVGLGLLIWANWDKIKGWTSAAWDWIWEKIKGVGQLLLDFFLNFTLLGIIINHWDSIKSGTVTAWNAIVDWVSKVPGMIVGFFLNWTLPGLIFKHWDKIKSGVAAKATELVAYISQLPKRIRDGIGSLGTLLSEKGRNIVSGLWEGIKSMRSWIEGKITGFAKQVIPGPIARALGIHSPSRVTAAQGKWIAKGLVQGLTGSAAQVKAASAKLAAMVTDGLRPGKKRSAALGKISAGSKQLVALATREAKVATQLKAAQKRVTDQIAARDKLAADVRKGVIDGGSILSMDGPATADTIINSLAARVDQATRFAQQLATLRKKGVRSDLIAQIAQAGVEQGAASAAVLANASASQVKQMNSQQAALVKAADAAGKTAGDAMYGSGIQAAQGLVKGLQSQQKAIEKQMLTIAKGMQKAIRQALGIKSPSRVMAAIGRYIPQGLVRGIDGERAAVDRSMAALVDPSAVPAPSGAVSGSYGGSGAGAGTAPAPIVLEIRGDGSRRADWLIDELRDQIQIKGGDVQLVLGKRR